MKKYVNEICLPYLVPEIWLFVYICLHFEAESQIVPKHLNPIRYFLSILTIINHLMRSGGRAGSKRTYYQSGISANNPYEPPEIEGDQ